MEEIKTSKSAAAEPRTTPLMRPKFQLGRIYSKYIIIQVLSYASDRDQVVRYIPKVSRRYR
jgi:hypothetical protein